jgi:hypothetical protein
MSEITNDIKTNTIEVNSKLGLNFSSYDSRLKHTGQGILTIQSDSSHENAINLSAPYGGININANDDIKIGSIPLGVPITIGSSTSDVTIRGIVTFPEGISGILNPTQSTSDFLSYSVNCYVLNSAFTNQTYFSILKTANYNVSPTPVINFNNYNNLTLNTTTGVIYGFNSLKYYEIEIIYMKNPLTIGSGTGIHNIGIYDDSITEIGSSLLNYITILPSNTIFHTLIFKIIKTNLTKINPVLKFNSATYTGGTNIYSNCISVNIKEL